MIIQILKYKLIFKQPAGTSRGVMKTKDTWFIKLIDESNGKSGLGEINMFKGLSSDDTPGFTLKLEELYSKPLNFINKIHEKLLEFPSIRFGLEMALLDLKTENPNVLFENDFTKGKKGIPINGLIWMGDIDFMKSQIAEKLDRGFNCLKMKIGAINFEEEYKMLRSIRNEFSGSDLELRVDANGAFQSFEALHKLEKLSKLNIHSIEQPIRQGNWENMAALCEKTPLAIALDEELIGVHLTADRKKLLDKINPQYIILKPALTGGFQSSEEWINMALKRNIGWWITSALESNVGLNAIAQWTASLNTQEYQGLGTGQLYVNNIESPLFILGERLFYNTELNWQNIGFNGKEI